MKRLAIDTSASFCAAAVYDVAASNVLACVSRDIGRGHAEVLMDVLGCCMSDAATKYSDISSITVTIGPGSFTGVRVGLATARGLGLALSIPVNGISTLDTCAIFAQENNDIPNLVTLIDAKRGEAYCKIGEGKAFVESYDDLETLISKTAVLAGSGAPVFNEASQRSHETIHTASVAPIELIAGLLVDDTGLAPEPLYLRSADAKPQAGFILPRAGSETSKENKL